MIISRAGAKLLSVGFLLAMLLFVFPAVPPPGSSGQAATPKDTAANVTVGSGDVTVGSSITTDITVNGYSGSAGLAAYDFSINFDASKVTVNSVAGSDVPGSPFGAQPTANILNLGGSNRQLRFTAFHPVVPGPTGPSIKVARATWTAVAQGTATLALTITTLTDATGTEFTGVGPINGTISIWQVPVASFTKSLNPSSGATPNTVSFTDTSNPPGQRFSWDFGDGSGSSSQNPTKIYSTPGNFTATLVVTNPAGSSASSQSLSFYSVPAASFTASATSANPGNAIAFTDGSAGNIMSWNWNFGDGTTSSTRNPIKTYSLEGNYAVSLTVSNPVGTNTLTRSNYITIMGTRAETAMTVGVDNYAYIGGQVNRFFNPATSETIDLPDGVGAFDAFMTYSSSGISIKQGVGMGLFTSSAIGLDVLSGTRSTVVAFQTGATPHPPIELFRLYPWLIGSKDSAHTVTLHFNTVSATSGTEFSQYADVSKTFRRGDANNNGAVTVTDAMFIAQYLAGLRTLGETTDKVNPINSATVQNDSSTQGSAISITDALFIAQMLAIMRDASFNVFLVPPTPTPAPTATPTPAPSPSPGPSPTPTRTPTPAPTASPSPVPTPSPSPSPSPSPAPMPSPSPVPTPSPSPVPTPSPPVPGFALSATPASRTVTKPNSTTYTVTVIPSGGFAGSVSLSLTSAPTGVTASFSPNPATSSSVMFVTVAANAVSGTLTIQGASGGLTPTTTVNLTVQ